MRLCYNFKVFKYPIRGFTVVRFVDKLYVSDNIAPKVSSIKLKTISGIGMVGVYFITLAQSRNDIFDIYSASVFKQRGIRKSDAVIIGIADSYSGAIELTGKMISECIEGDINPLGIRQYFEQYVSEHI